MEEVLVAVAREDKAEAFVADESLDRAIHRGHALSLLLRIAVGRLGGSDGCVITVVAPQIEHWERFGSANQPRVGAPAFRTHFAVGRVLHRSIAARLGPGRSSGFVTVTCGHR